MKFRTLARGYAFFLVLTIFLGVFGPAFGTDGVVIRHAIFNKPQATKVSVMTASSYASILSNAIKPNTHRTILQVIVLPLTNWSSRFGSMPIFRWGFRRKNVVGEIGSPMQSRWSCIYSYDFHSSHEPCQESRTSADINDIPIYSERRLIRVEGVAKWPQIGIARTEHNPGAFKPRYASALEPNRPPLPKSEESINGRNIDNGPSASRWPDPKLVSIILWPIAALICLAGWATLGSEFSLWLRIPGFLILAWVSLFLFYVSGGLFIFGYWWLR